MYSLSSFYLRQTEQYIFDGQMERVTLDNSTVVQLPNDSAKHGDMDRHIGRTWERQQWASVRQQRELDTKRLQEISKAFFHDTESFGMVKS